jgi:transcriptional regulator with XRE-family HTH domain
MPSASPPLGAKGTRSLTDLGEHLRARRKELKLSAVATAEAARMSRVTLHRIERGEPSVSMGAYMGVIDALGLELDLREPGAGPRPALPRSIRLASYPQLRKLAWQLRVKKTLSPREALDVYERNWRHLEQTKLTAPERELILRLLESFGRERLLV